MKWSLRNGVVWGAVVGLLMQQGMAAGFFVAPSGSDRNPGTKTKPFQTITRARDAVAKINAGMKEDITVHLAGGA